MNSENKKILSKCIIVFSASLVFGFVLVSAIECYFGKEIVDFAADGAFFGGVTAMVFGAITASVTFAAFYIQYLANEHHKQEIMKSITRSNLFDLLYRHRELTDRISLKLHDGTMESGETALYSLRLYIQDLYGTMKKIATEHYGETNFTNDEIMKNTYKLFWNGLEKPNENKEDFFWNAAYVLLNDCPCPESPNFGEQNYDFKVLVSGHRQSCADKNVFMHAQRDSLHTFFHRISQMFRFVAIEKNLESWEKPKYNDLVLNSTDEFALVYYHCLAGMFGKDTEQVFSALRENSFYNEFANEIKSLDLL